MPKLLGQQFVLFDFGIYLKIFKMSIFGGINVMGGNGKLNMSRYFSIIISIIIYFQNLMNSFEVSKNTNEIPTNHS